MAKRANPDPRINLNMSSVDEYSSELTYVTAWPCYKIPRPRPSIPGIVNSYYHSLSTGKDGHPPPPPPHSMTKNWRTLTYSGLVSLYLSQQVSFTELLTHFLLPSLDRAHGHGRGEGRKKYLQKQRHCLTRKAAHKSVQTSIRGFMSDRDCSNSITCHT